MNQGERVIEYIKRFGSITPMEAFMDLGITKLATRISELIQEGMEFKKEYIKSQNRFGEPVHYMRYSFPEEGDVNGSNKWYTNVNGRINNIN